MVLFPLTLNDPQLPQTTPFSHFVPLLLSASLWMTDHPQMGVVGSRGPFFNVPPNHICRIGEAWHLKFRVLIDTQEYQCMHDILPKKGCVQSHVTSLNIGK